MSEEKEVMGLASFLNSHKWVTEGSSKLVKLEIEPIRKAEKGEILHLSSGDVVSDGEDIIYRLKNG